MLLYNARIDINVRNLRVSINGEGYVCVSKEVEYKVIGSLLIVYQKDRKRHRSPDWFGICPSKKGNLPALI